MFLEHVSYILLGDCHDSDFAVTSKHELAGPVCDHIVSAYDLALSLALAVVLLISQGEPHLHSPLSEEEHFGDVVQLPEQEGVGLKLSGQ